MNTEKHELCPECNMDISYLAAKHCCECGKSLAALHSCCRSCGYGIIESMSPSPIRFCPMCGEAWDPVRP
jgi:hypothetical protein